MGGLFSAPKPVAIEPPRVETATEANARNAATAEEAAREARLRAVERARRGLAGTIATGARGVLEPLPSAGGRKTLLGE